MYFGDADNLENNGTEEIGLIVNTQGESQYITRALNLCAHIKPGSTEVDQT